MTAVVIDIEATALPPCPHDPQIAADSLQGLRALRSASGLKRLRHRVGRTRAEFALHWSVFNVAAGLVEAARGLSAGECATHIASLDRPGFERAE
jgi:hypothetical protein